MQKKEKKKKTTQDLKIYELQKASEDITSSPHNDNILLSFDKDDRMMCNLVEVFHIDGVSNEAQSLSNKRKVIPHRHFNIEGKSYSRQNHDEITSSSIVEDAVLFDEALSSPAWNEWMSTIRDKLDLLVEPKPGIGRLALP